MTINSWTCLGPWKGHTSNRSWGVSESDWIIIFNCYGSTSVFGWWIILFRFHKFKISKSWLKVGNTVPWNLEIQCNNPILDLIFFFQVTMSNHDPQIVQNCTSNWRLCWRKCSPDWQSFLIFFLYLVIPHWAHRVSFQRDLKFDFKCRTYNVVPLRYTWSIRKNIHSTSKKMGTFAKLLLWWRFLLPVFSTLIWWLHRQFLPNF